MKGNEVDCMLLRIDSQPVDGGGRDGGVRDLPGGLFAAGARSVESISLSAGSTEAVDAALASLDGRRLVIAAAVPDLLLALRRLMRLGELATTSTAVLSPEPAAYLRALGLPTGEREQLEIAVHGRPRLVGVIKDDSGGLCLDQASLTPWTTRDSAAGRPIPWWLRAVVDDQPLCDGPASSVSVRRLLPGQLEATVHFGRRLGHRRHRRLRGRSLQLACDEALTVQDGLGRERPRTKRTFWAEPNLWKLCLGP
jgi:hypothetical protein